MKDFGIKQPTIRTQPPVLKGPDVRITTTTTPLAPQATARGGDRRTGALTGRLAQVTIRPAPTTARPANNSDAQLRMTTAGKVDAPRLTIQLGVMPKPLTGATPAKKAVVGK